NLLPSIPSTAKERAVVPSRKFPHAKLVSTAMPGTELSEDYYPNPHAQHRKFCTHRSKNLTTPGL
ncbi:hypothetical protein NL514_32555, partial [Klebsiella pneumoniae]|nr:hypothetical protein [Klebsiella pneumoniae]